MSGVRFSVFRNKAAGCWESVFGLWFSASGFRVKPELVLRGSALFEDQSPAAEDRKPDTEDRFPT